jgi:hypothetical protein
VWRWPVPYHSDRHGRYGENDRTLLHVLACSASWKMSKIAYQQPLHRVCATGVLLLSLVFVLFETLHPVAEMRLDPLSGRTTHAVAEDGGTGEDLRCVTKVFRFHTPYGTQALISVARPPVPSLPLLARLLPTKKIGSCRWRAEVPKPVPIF